MTETLARPAQVGGRRQRQLKNFLLDRHFQLKYTGYLVAIALALSGSLGVVLWRTSETVVDQSRQNVERGAQIVALGKEVVAESQKVSAVVRMNIVKDPVYQESPDLLAAFNDDAAEQESRLSRQQAALEAQRQELAAQSARLETLQTAMLWSLIGVLALLVAAIGVAGIIVTHKVAGPIFKMRRQLGDVAEGRWALPAGLRKGDELVDFHEAFRAMVASLRDRRGADIQAIGQAIGEIEQAGGQAPETLHRLQRELQASLS